MPFRYEVLHRRRQQPRLIDVPAPEDFLHVIKMVPQRKKSSQGDYSDGLLARAQVREARDELLPPRTVEVHGQLLGIAGALDRQDDAAPVLGMRHARAAAEAGRGG